MGDSNKCMFRFTNKRGSFNSPRFPANVSLFFYVNIFNKLKNLFKCI